MGIIAFFKKAFSDMKKSAIAQHEVDRAEFRAVAAESRASFEENRGHNTYRRAKAGEKKSWDEAHMTPSEREKKAQEERKARIAAAEARTAAAVKRTEAARRK